MSNTNIYLRRVMRLHRNARKKSANEDPVTKIRCTNDGCRHHAGAYHVPSFPYQRSEA